MRRIIYLAAAAGALFLVISCASTPPQQPKQQAPQPQAVQPTAAAPDAELAQAKGLQQRVDAIGLGTYDPDDYQAANKDLQAGQDSYGKDNTAARTSLQSAIAEYNAVLSKGGALYLAQAQQQAEASKKVADELKASVAVKDDYAAANDLYTKALSEKDAGDIEGAAKDFVQARDGFDAVSKVAQQKKDAAMQALQSAQQESTVSQQKAEDAQKALTDEGFTASGNAQ
jgi:hypothetical protein